jgi:serine-type D-Ala-D-Ala carboxypeptidase (penicillin-binding protein 5/6)
VLRLVFRAGWCACVCSLLATLALPLSTNAQESTAPAEPDIAAMSAIVIDAATGEVLYDRDSQLRLPPASLTKIFTAVMALESAPLDRRMLVEPDDLVGEASMGLAAGETLSLETLLYGLLLPSGNDAAATIGRNLGGGSLDAFMTAENARIAELGLTNTALINPHGLDAHLHYSSARDLAAMTLFALRTQPDFARISGAMEYHAEGHDLFQTNDLHVTYPGIVAGKTGVTDEAGFCLMEVADRDGHRVITVLLGSTSDAWYGDAQLLLDYGFATLATPGRLPATDVISIGAEAVVAAPAAVVQQSQQTAPAPNPANATSLQVVPIGQGTSLVNEPAIASTSKRSPWLWLTLPFILVSAVLYLLAHLGRRTIRRAERRAAPTRAPHSANQPAAQVIWETASFPIVTAREPVPSIWNPVEMQHNDDNDLHLIWERATRERLLRGRSATYPSFGD